MEQLREQLDKLIVKLENADELRFNLEELVSVYPFNEFEFVISHLLATKVLLLNEYYELRQSYIDRNLYLHLFEIAPRTFGELWAQGHLKELVPSLERPSKDFDTNYKGGEYDFFLPPNIRIEVKASRAVEYKNNQALSLKALLSSSKKQFDMNFQQIKPKYCDVFVWFGIWRDVIKCWVIPSFEVEQNKYFSYKQHRGNVGEGQLHIKHNNIALFDKYIVPVSQIEAAIRAAFEREMQQRNQ